MRNFALLSSKDWHKSLYETFNQRLNENWYLITNEDELDYENILSLGLEKLFIPHWSKIIEPKIIDAFDCVIFHMTDLPFGRGGSPLQNLIVRGYENTMISALKATNELDAGPVYLKSPLSLLGTAQEVFIRSTRIIQSMIEKIIDENILPSDQEGEPTFFKRRKPEDGDIVKLESVTEVFDYIRMLDCDGYPAAFLETKNFRFEFSRASLKAEGEIIADVRIIQK